MKLAYSAYDRTGRQVSGTIDSSDVAVASESLYARGLYVTEIVEAAAGAVGAKLAKGRQFAGGRAKRMKDLAMFTRQLAVLVQSGTQLVDALGALERQTKAGPWRNAISAMPIQSVISPK